MDNNAQKIFNAFQETLIELKDKVLQSIKYVESEEKLIIGEKTFQTRNYEFAILGFGKSSSFIVQRLVSNLPDKRISYIRSISSVKPITGFDYYAAHPIPNENNFFIANQVLRELTLLKRRTLIIIVISGGGSSIFSLPEEGVEYQDKIAINNYLLYSGLDCRHVNEVRKVISKIKGGKLLKYINANTIVNIVISDDILSNNNLISPPQYVASGPTVPQKVNGELVYSLLSISNLWVKLSQTTRDSIIDCNREIINVQQSFQKVHSITMANNRMLIELFAQKLSHIASKVIVRLDPLSDNLKRASVNFYKEFCEESVAHEKVIYLSGGEVTCEVFEDSKGGRCQHFVSSLISYLGKSENEYCLALASDGEDHIKECCGAYISSMTITECKNRGIDFERLIQGYNSNHLLSKTDTLFGNMPNSLNLGDVYILYKLK